MEEKLINEIRELFSNLVEEEHDSYVPGSQYKLTLPPNSSRYCINLKELISKAEQLSVVNPKYNSFLLDEILVNDLPAIENHKYVYKTGAKQPTQKSKDELISLMHKTTYRIKLNFYEVLGDIPFD